MVWAGGGDGGEIGARNVGGGGGFELVVEFDVDLHVGGSVMLESLDWGEQLVLFELAGEVFFVRDPFEGDCGFLGCGVVGGGRIGRVDGPPPAFEEAAFLGVAGEFVERAAEGANLEAVAIAVVDDVARGSGAGGERSLDELAGGEAFGRW